MKDNSSTNKCKIACPFCHQQNIKQYISMHIKKMHKNSLYSQMVSRGMRYNLCNSKNISDGNLKFFCSICKREITSKSSYMHLKTKLHKLLQGNKNINNENPPNFGSLSKYPGINHDKNANKMVPNIKNGRSKKIIKNLLYDETPRTPSISSDSDSLESSESGRSIGRSNTESFWKNPKNLKKYSDVVDKIILRLQCRRQKKKDNEIIGKNKDIAQKFDLAKLK